MEKLDRDTDGSSLNIVQDNIEKLKTLFPDIFAEGKIDFDKLKATLRDTLETQEERYNFTWHGKAQARRIAQTPSTGTLLPCKEESKNWDTTQNLFIEGDNLEVLKLLQKSYHKQVKMIYIDPPYNTGKEFIYPDNYQDNLDTYLQYTGQKDNEGRKFGTNAETSGRYHTNWLNMMYPRLKLARNLLRDDGVIFISIDDNEVANLRKICDEIFGEDNLLTIMTIKVRYEGKTLVEDMNFQKLVENVLVYAKTKHMVKLKKPEKDYDFSKFEWFVSEIGKPTVTEIGGKKVEIFSIGDYEITKKEPNNFGLKEIWATGTILDGNSSGRFFRDYLGGRSEVDGLGVLYKVYGIGDDDLPYRYFTGPKKLTATKGKYYQGIPKDILENKNEVKKVQPIITFIDLAADFGNCRHEGGVDFRSGKKPLALLRRLFSMIESYESDLILDFFAGSATTAHATIQLNSEDGMKRKFICIQLPEPTEDVTLNTISDIGKERIRRAGEKILKDNAGKDGIENFDIGFKVFKLDSSNIKPWDGDFDNLESALFDTVNNIKEDRSEDDVLFEILLKYGLDLTVPIEERQIVGKTVYAIGFGALVICLDDAITLDVVEGIGQLKDELAPEVMRVVFKDSGFQDDVVKTNAIQILKKHGVDDVKSL